MANKLPIKLSKEPLLDSVFELRFADNLPLSSILPGLFYDKLAGEKTIEQLQLSTFPKQMRDNDPNLKHAPLTRVTWNNFLLLIGDYSVIVGCKMPYPGWAKLKETILMVVDILKAVEGIKSIQRYSLKYVDLLPYKNLRDQIAAVKLKIQLDKHSLENEVFQFRIEIKQGAYINLVQIVSNATATSLDKTKKEGLVVDIDTICVVDNVKIADFVIDLQNKLDEIHQLNKNMFFSCITSKTLEELGPIYE